MALLALMPAGALFSADASSTQPGVSAKDFSTPSAAVKSYLQASYNQLDLAQKQDDAAVTDTLILPADAGQKQAAQALLDLTSATAQLEHACADKFGAAVTTRTLGNSGRDLLVARLKTIDEARVTLTGDTATMQIPEEEIPEDPATKRPASKQPAGTVILKKIGGDWKIDAASLWGLSAKSADQLKSMTSLTGKLTDATHQVAADVRAGKFPSAKDAYNDLHTRIAEALPAAPAAGPATLPAAAPHFDETHVVPR